ncbi:MAG TPA: 4-(cytidine 5'-diphospho)-2-C-methyl-D-erythritol kinase [Deltaproteobacteria bacterium]|nr:MAG: 4-(cytidine 5'-diphospho)-2-C-methyl-D-erythritol kinase [Deltaproteobacteria bacterium GWD2_42_10]OGP48235.1 MAG: 4-(cytidine 5'-diphospho)-2-C-methyl-D-erythritol kinase [Deltaproteobacteria bacterium GWF2_42_12]OGQ27010.1 MAG: 4-(cytidine 5'-diphospho)-2-C-methyl-D-erythritol kinase [Deltaproteobacteria bacterium RIFCSPHIGHO2_02_FULL_42_44]OGQ37358.1 MAG: 4-(cytidine 5'-diphospho)-2-C-methyl-D-erythritol kinase [Deltaproteobacteria bacterium RIFCSPLOWO2_02_FULL_42_39]HAG52052.1 4-(cy
MPSIQTYLSPAKVNLFLRVLRKRADGYHDIMSLMQPISLYDEISLDIREGRGISIECDNISIPVDRTNLAFKAAEAFFKTTGINNKAIIKIKKRIPVAAGLGGGSSNAATVLMALNELTSLNLSANDLAKIGLAIGSDVPFFLVGKPCLAKGRGEILEPVELPKFWYVLINPGFPVSTQWVYRNLNLTKNIENININISKVSKNIVAIQRLLINDLEAVTLRKHYEIQELKDALLALDATGALMSGSGPTVFGVFLNKGKAKKAFEQIKKDRRFKDMAVFIAQGL